jgi:hypothetical protein
MSSSDNVKALDVAVVRDLVCSFLDRESMIHLMEESELSQHFLLREFFCLLHGTKLKDAEDDARESFLYSDPHPVLRSSDPDCHGQRGP